MVEGSRALGGRAGNPWAGQLGRIGSAGAKEARMEGGTAETSAPWTVADAGMAGMALARAHMTAQQLPGTQKAPTQLPHELCQPDPQLDGLQLRCRHHHQSRSSRARARARLLRKEKLPRPARRQRLQARQVRWTAARPSRVTAQILLRHKRRSLVSRHQSRQWFKSKADPRTAQCLQIRKRL